MAQNDNVVFKTSTTATIDDLFSWNKSTGQITAKTDNIPIVPGTVYFTADGHIVHDLAQNNRLWMSKNAYSAIYAEDVAETNTDIANAIKYSIHYVEGPTTDTTPGTWTGTINGITELYDGLTIIYVPAVAGGSSTTTLNINGLGAKTCYYSNTSAMTTHYSVGTPILLTYRNNCWRRADYNSNTTYSAMSVAEMRTGTATSERSVRADYLKTFLSTLGGTNLTLTHSNSAPYLQLNHDPSGITAGTYGNNSQQNPSYGGTFNIPYFTVDTQGHITNASVTTVKIPESDNTDYKVRQTPINSNDNNNYRILLSNSANNTLEDSVSKKNANLIYNPTENKLSTGNIKLTGELDVTGNVYLRNQTAVDNLTAGSLIVNGNSTFNNDINLAQGAVKWTSNSLPSVTSADYFLVIDAFANGGATKYITKADAIKSLISSSAIGSSTKPVYWTGNAFSAITSYSGAAALTGTPTAPTAAVGTSTTQIATTEFVTNAVAQGFIANDAMVFKGLIGSNQPITQLPTSGYNAGWTYRVANAGIFAGEYCEVGDLLIAIKDGPASGSSVINTDWGKVEHNIDGAVFRGSGASNSSVGSSTQPVYVNGSGIVTAITGAIANNTTGNAATATKVYSTHTYPTTKSYIEYQQDQATGSGNVNLRHHNALAVSSNMDTSSTNTKWTELQIGNTIASGTVGNSQGRIALYGSGSNYTQITTSGIGNNNYFYIPNYSGNGYAVTHSADTALGSTTQPIYLQANGRAAAVSWYPKYCTIDGWNTANYPWHRFATCTTGTNQHTDRDAIIVIYSRCKGGKYGIIRVSVRTNATNSTNSSIDIEARWIFRQGFSVEDVRIAKTGNTTGIDTRIDVYVKCAAYPRRYAYLLEGPNNGFNLINSYEARDTTADDKKTSVEAYEDVTTSVGYTAYNAVQSATDFGTVNHSNVTTGANLTTTANAVAYYTDVVGTFGSKASANGALYATSANGSLQWGTLPMAQGGTGATTAAGARTNLGLGTMATEAANSYIAKSIGTAKGDIIYWSAANTPAKLNIGSVGQVLKVSSNGIPVWSNVNITPANILGSSSTAKFWRGDNTWSNLIRDAHSKSLSTFVAIAGSDNAWNKAGNYNFAISNSNNMMVFNIGGTSDDRNAYIQVGHNSPDPYGNITGNLYLNKLGGQVYINENYAARVTSAISGQVMVADGEAGGIKTTGYTINKSVPANAEFTDRYVNSATFADDSTNTAASPVKMTLTRAGSDTATVTASIPKVSSSSAGVAPKGAAVSSQNQNTKFLREDGTWAAPSYTVNTNTDTLVKQTAKTDNVEYKILTTTSASPTSGNAAEAAYDTGITINPCIHRLSAAQMQASAGLYSYVTSTVNLSGYIKFATLTVTKIYFNRGIQISYASRSNTGGIIYCIFSNTNNTDPNLTITKTGPAEIYYKKSDTSTWDLYISKTENHDQEIFSIINPGQLGVISNPSDAITWKSEHVAELPEGYLTAAVHTIKLNIIGNAATATTAGGITSPGTTAQFWRGDNSWSNMLEQTATTTLGINTSDLRIGRAIRTLHIATSDNGTGAGITDGNAAGITFGVSNAAYAGIYYQSSESYGSRLYFATTRSFGNGAYARMVITRDGNVGIGTTSPSTLLHVAGDMTVTGLTASQAVATDANKKLVSTNLTTADPTASGTDISYIATISQSATGKITATKSTVRSASTSQTGVLQFTANNTNAQLNTLTTGSTTPTDNDYYISQYVGGGTTITTYHRRPVYALWNYISGKITNGIYWGNVKTTSAATYKAQPEVASIKINGKTAAGDTNSTSAKNVQLIYDASLETLNFVFS